MSQKPTALFTRIAMAAVAIFIGTEGAKKMFGNKSNGQQA